MLYNKYSGQGGIVLFASLYKINPKRSESRSMLKQIFSLTTNLSAPAVATVLLALYGVALVTHTVAGITIV